MSAISKIQWTDRTWNPVRGCSIVSPGCINCYAMKQAHRFSGNGRAYKGLTKQTKAGPQWTGEIRTVESALDEPYCWKQPQRVFVNSMSDLFHEGVPFEFISEVFTTMWQNTRHTFQILTKRPERMLEFYRWNYRSMDPREAEADWLGCGPNIWLGVSCEDQQRADERIPLLLQTPAAVRFISAEPLLGPISLVHGVDWVIVGGESGPKARPCESAWIGRLVGQCVYADVPCFVKQVGAHVIVRNDSLATDRPAAYDDLWPEPPEGWDDGTNGNIDRTDDGYQGAPIRIFLKDSHGGDPSEWPADLRLREFPSAVSA